MRSRTFSVLGVAFLLAGGITAAASPASALACPTQANPNTLDNAYTYTSRTVGGRTNQLRYGYSGTSRYVWSRLATSVNGDQVWVDLSSNGGSSWMQCGLTTLQADRNWSYAYRKNSGVCVRVGFRPKGGSTSYVTPASGWWC
ncbi:hypothetical protein FDA94_33330 [Herbidospora galbida]|uniref:SH3 domain-containing protein n=1 Tax=Herbidospora galbida TaxID=2575442 RepID=A0A4U3LZ62_9ACTN|nr:hypothetical protein [Herbidospora galbida]TKK81260.1 hypothetical protein FDA94_33330 [Herbidospora galbida]